MRSTNRGNAEVDVNDYRQVCMGLCFFVIKMDYYYFIWIFLMQKKKPKKNPNKTGANYLEHECVVYLYTCTNDIMPI